MMKRKIYMIIALILVLFVSYVLNSLHSAGLFKTVTPHLDGKVNTIYTSMPGPEDMDVDYQKGLLFISSTDRWKQTKGETVDGGIYLMPLDSGTAPRKLPTTYPKIFRPHGISLFSKNNNDYLFVVNHSRDDENSVELFQFKRDTLFHLRSFSNAAMCCPNDVVGVDTDKFYVTNDHGTKKGTMRKVEDYFRLPWSSLLYFNGSVFSTAYEGLTYANGVNISNDANKLYLTHTTGRELLTFRRNKEAGELKLIDKLNLKSGVDNIHVDESDHLWIASHPKMLKFIAHAKDSRNLSPSQVFKLTPLANSYQVDEVYLDDGRVLSGASVAVSYKHEMFVGVVFENKILRAELNQKIR